MPTRRTVVEALSGRQMNLPQQNVVAEMVDQKIGGTTDYASFDANGNLTFSGTAKLTRSIGWTDIFPFDSGGDGTNSAAFTLITGHRYGYEFPGSGAFKQRCYKYHIGHDIDLAATTYYAHIHWEHNTTNPTGNAVFTMYVTSALRDGAFTAEDSMSITVTPTNANKNSNMVTEVEVPFQLVNLKPDTIYFVYVMRDPAHVNDTFSGGSVWVHGWDFHAAHDGKITTSKDPGTGWKKVNV